MRARFVTISRYRGLGNSFIIGRARVSFWANGNGRNVPFRYRVYMCAECKKTRREFNGVGL